MRSDLRWVVAAGLIFAVPILPAPSSTLGDGVTQHCLGRVATIVGTTGPDRLVGTNGRDVIAGREGHDIILGRAGSDVICGGGGNDDISGDGGADELLGGPGADELLGGPGADTCFQARGAGSKRSCELPVRAAFYYPWFPEAWEQEGIKPYTNFEPSLGLYSTSHRATVKEHIAAMRYGRIKVGIASWWGRGSRTDRRVRLLLKAAAGTPFKWTIYYEPEGQGDPSVKQIRADLRYIRDQYTAHGRFFRLGRRFVVFVYADSGDACDMVSRWRSANTVGAYVVLKVFSDYLSCAGQPQGWHQYAPSVADDDQPPFSYSISPGFWKVDESPRLARDLDRWRRSVQRMASARVKFRLVTTFNEWGEGTVVESAKEWSSPSGRGDYLDALRARKDQS